MLLYQNFVAGFAHKINLLKLAFFAVAVSKQMAKPQVGGAALGARTIGRLSEHSAHYSLDDYVTFPHVLLA